jgi:hypothetical protein
MTSPSASPAPKSKRRFLQFSLRTFFILLTVFAIWFGWMTSKTRQQKKAVEWVREMRGMVRYDYEVDDEGLKIDATEPLGAGWLREFLGVDVFADVVRVDIHKPQVKDVTPLAELKNLQSLWLDGTQVNKLTPLAGLKNLQRLYLDYTPVTDLTPLAGLENLERLSLRNTPVTEPKPLAGLKNLKELYFRGSQVTDLTPLVGLTNLRTLSLDDTPVIDLTPLAELKNLRTLFPSTKNRLILVSLREFEYFGRHDGGIKASQWMFAVC